ncbi:MAG: class III extradiol dioxygenase subunit B-like domain-containing protein [Dethiobacteria bacterium]|nr:class III extradiol dioxygenase subunit B-like domain-containing protein [Dethiobacteria bacterium]
MLSLIGIAPHPPIIIPAIGRSELGKARQTVDGMRLLAEKFKAASPEQLIVITPHGQAMREGPTVLTQDLIKGDFAQFGFPEIKVEFQSDHQLLTLLETESAAGPLRPIFLDDRSYLLRSGKPLDHGAMVPLYYLHEAGLNIPGLHITFGFNTLRQLYQFGRALRRAVNKRGLPAAVLASGDLSHRLNPGAPAGFNPRGAEYDQLLVELLRDGRVEDILDFDLKLVDEAGECGLRSFVIALGMLDGETYKAEIISYEGPFGVGYLVAALYPLKRDESGNVEGGLG